MKKNQDLFSVVLRGYFSPCIGQVTFKGGRKPNAADCCQEFTIEEFPAKQMVKMVEQLISKSEVVGSTPTTLLEFFSFFHSHIHNIQHDISPVVVEACLKNSYCSMAQSKGTLMVQCHPRIQDLNPCPCQALLQNLNCVWCRVELKVVGNLECRIKFYRKKNRGTSSIQLNILILQLTV